MVPNVYNHNDDDDGDDDDEDSGSSSTKDRPTKTYKSNSVVIIAPKRKLLAANGIVV